MWLLILSSVPSFLKISFRFLKSFRRYENYLRLTVFINFFGYFYIFLLQRDLWLQHIKEDMAINNHTVNLLSTGCLTIAQRYIEIRLVILEIWRVACHIDPQIWEIHRGINYHSVNIILNLKRSICVGKQKLISGKPLVIRS